MSIFKGLFKPKGKQEFPEVPHSGFHNLSYKSFLHSGKAGDIIYSLPTVLELNKHLGDISFYLNIIQPHNHKIDKHFNGKSVEMLIPLLERQSYISKSKLFENEPFEINLDAFREIILPIGQEFIAQMVFFRFNIHADLSKPWLEADYLPEYKDKIVITRSKRYQNPHINRKFLNQYNNLIFLGLEKEYQTIRKEINNIEFVRINDFLEMANIINSCRLFIGNQSLPYTIAEALKVPRILEVPLDSPNNIPYGKNGYDFLYQDAFEEIVKEILAK